MACQLARPLIPHSSLIRSTGLQLGMPCLGQCLNLGASSKTKNADIVVLLGHTVRSRLAHCMQTVESSCAHAKPVGEVGVRCT